MPTRTLPTSSFRASPTNRFSSTSSLVFLTALLVCILFKVQPARAGEPLFGYLYTTDLAPQGKFEFEQWFTDRHGQAGGSFDHLDMATEVEYGLTDDLQVSIYADYMYAYESANSVRGLTEGMEIPYNHDSTRPYNTGRFDGIKLELTYRILSPYTDPFGLAIQLEPEFGSFESGVELRTILQKNFFGDQLILAANLWVEWDKEHETNLVTPGSSDVPDGAVSNATYAEIDLGASFRFAPKWYGGLEFRNHNEYTNYTLAHSAQDHTAFFLGPNIHYATQDWFATLSILRQLGVIAYTDEQKAQMKNGLLYGNEHTTWDGIRLIVGIPF